MRQFGKLFSGIGVILYFVMANAVSEIAARRRIGKPKLAWVPVANAWLLGSIADHYELAVTGKDRSHGKKLLGWTIVRGAILLLQLVLNFFPERKTLLVILLILEIVAAVLYQVFYCLAMYRIYQSCAPKHAVWMLVLTIVAQPAAAIILFCIRKKDEGLENLATGESPAEGGER